MDKILCRVEPGLGQHKVYYYENDILQSIEQIDYKDLAVYLISSCHNDNCYDLYLTGSPLFLQDLIENIKTKEASEYNESKIKIEVI